MDVKDGSENKDTIQSAEVISIIDIRVTQLERKANYYGLLDAWSALDVRLAYGENLNRKEAMDYVVLTKYLQKHGHNEAIKIKCTKIYERYMKDYGM